MISRSAINKKIYSVRLLRYLDRFIDGIVTRKRNDMFRRIFGAGLVRLDTISSVLDVGSTNDKNNASSNFFARKLASSSTVTLLSDQPIDAQRDIDFAAERALIGDATNFGPEVGLFDLVLSSATIEHVGNADSQRRMIGCCIRAARKYVVITTPNRWYPVEFHTRLPLLHWLPRNLHRRILKTVGLGFFADEQNLNLLDRRELRFLANSCDQRERIKVCRLETIRLFGLVSNLILILELK